jgi:high-affinity nickel-transport protein
LLNQAVRVFTQGSEEVRRRIVLIYALLLGFNALVWGLTLLASTAYPFLLPTGLLAYTFGLRHAVDADHISAIDNTTRKLLQDNKRPVAVGFFFSLGHSTIVVTLSVLLALSTGFLQHNLPGLRAAGSMIGTTVSATFLYIIAIINLIVIWDIYRIFKRVRAGGQYEDQTLEEFLNNRGVLARMFKPMLRMVKNSWNMYPIGVLFGLGFDTASEVAILGISAASAANHLPIQLIVLLPLLFTAGMSLIDTTDGILMLGAYGWAFVKPIRKLYYNLNITLISVLVALGVGSIEFLQVIDQATGWQGSFWNVVNNLSFGSLGYLIIAVFLVSWAASTAVYKLKGYDAMGAPAAEG